MRILTHGLLKYVYLKNFNGYYCWGENTSSGGVSVLACPFLSCSPSLCVCLSHSCSSLPLCSWSAGLFFVFRWRASAVGFSLGANRCYRSFKTVSFPVLAYFTRRTRQCSTEFSCVCIYLSVCNGIQKSENWDFKKALRFLNAKLKLIMGQSRNVIKSYA